MVTSHIRSSAGVDLNAGNGARRVLVVEGSSAVRLFYTHVLTRSGYQVEVAEDGLAGWHALHTHPFDLLIIDQHMSGLSGLELAAKVQSARMALPVILVATPLQQGKLAWNPPLRLAATLLKPFSPEQLENTVRKALAQPAGRQPTSTGCQKSF